MMAIVPALGPFALLFLVDDLNKVVALGTGAAQFEIVD